MLNHVLELFYRRFDLLSNYLFFYEWTNLEKNSALLSSTNNTLTFMLNTRNLFYSIKYLNKIMFKLEMNKMCSQ